MVRPLAARGRRLAPGHPLSRVANPSGASLLGNMATTTTDWDVHGIRGDLDAHAACRRQVR